MKQIIHSSFCAFVMIAGVSHAATIVYGFDTNNTAGGTSITSTVSSNDFGSGITASNWTATAGESGRPVYIDGQQMRMEKGPASDTHTFTITFGSTAASLTNLSFDYGKVGGDTGAPAWTVTSDLAGGTITPNTAIETPTSSNISKSASMNLGGTFASLSNTTVTFTLVDAAGGNNNLGNNGANVHYSFIDNVTLTGAVPEPSTALLGGLSLLALLRRRR